MTPPGTLAKAAAINRPIYCGMGSCFGRALSSFRADLAVLQKLLAAPHEWKEDAPVLHLWLPRCDAWQSPPNLGPLCDFPFGAKLSLTFLSPNCMSLTSVGLHLLLTGLDLGSVSAPSIGLDVMVSSGLSSRWTKEPFQSCGERGTT